MESSLADSTSWGDVRSPLKRAFRAKVKVNLKAYADKPSKTHNESVNFTAQFTILLARKERESKPWDNFAAAA